MPTKGAGAVAGYKYYLSFLAGICRGSINNLLEVKVGEKTAWAGAAGDTTTVTISQPALFGGDEKEGGVDGTLYTMFGAASQTVPTSIQNSLNGAGIVSDPDSDGLGGGEVIEPPGTGLVPSLRGVTTFFWKGLISANNPYLKTWKFKVRRTTAGWQNGTLWFSERASVSMDSAGDGVYDIVGMNAAHILYQCMTDSMWGRGLDTSLLSDASFRDAATTLYDEGIGLCIRYTRGDRKLSEFMAAVLDHVGGSLYLDRNIGQFVLTLHRGGYDASLLPSFDYNSGLLKVEDDQSGSADMAPNEIVIKWHDPITDKDRQTKVQNLAGIQSQGTVISQTMEFPGIATAAIAARIATRELTAAASGLKRFKLTFDRSARGLKPGGLFRFSDASRQISNMVCRVGKLTLPGPRDEGAITIECLQDVFSLPTTSYLGYQPPLISFPDSTPADASRVLADELTYRDLLRNLSATEIAGLDTSYGFLRVVASRPTQLSPTYELWTKTGSAAYAKAETAVWAPSGRLAADIGALDTSITLEKGSEWDSVVVNGPLQIGADEIVKVTAFNTTSGVATVVRGCLDTIPTAAVAGTVCYFYDDTIGTDRVEYTDGEVVSAKILAQLSGGILDIADATAHTRTIKRRWVKPYPPGNVKCSTVSGPTSIYLLDPVGEPPGDKTITWAQRNRDTQSDSFVGHTASTVSPPAGLTYTLRFYTDPGNVLKRTETGVTGTSFTYDTTMQVADGVGHRVRVELESVLSGETSTYKYSFIIPLLHSGFGYGFGNSYGVRP